jgi:TPR repeat protein
LREAVRRAPHDDEARHRLAQALLAREAAREAGTGRTQTYLDLGRQLIGQGQLAEAASWLREALRLEPGLGAARASLGLALHGMGDTDAAVAELRAAVRQDPELAQARLALAAALMARQEWPAARAELDQIVRLEPDHPQANQSLGVVRYTLGDLPGAIAAYRRALAAEPDHHDARYSLALLLKLAHREAEAATEFLAAARAGVPGAQYFAGAACAAGIGVERDLAQAVDWWFRAAEQGVPQAEDALTELRRVALGHGRRGGPGRDAAAMAFRTFRLGLWRRFPELPRTDDDSVGAALMRQGRAPEAVPVLILEASALGERAQELLVTLYEQGAPDQVPAHDPRILRWLRAAAAEGQVPPRP